MVLRWRRWTAGVVLGVAMVVAGCSSTPDTAPADRATSTLLPPAGEPVAPEELGIALDDAGRP